MLRNSFLFCCFAFCSFMSCSAFAQDAQNPVVQQPANRPVVQRPKVGQSYKPAINAPSQHNVAQNSYQAPVYGSATNQLAQDSAKSGIPAHVATIHPSESMYNHLNQTEKDIYDTVYAAVSVMTAKVVLPGLPTKEQIKRAVSSMVYDHPEMIWVDLNYNLGATEVNGVVREYDVEMIFNGLNHPKYVQAFEAEANRIIAEARKLKSPVEMEKYVHDYLVMNIEYLKSGNDQNAYTALVTKKTVCAGFAKSFKYLMDRLGIPTYYISGKSLDTEGNIGDHGWNIVKLNGRYYNIDVTSDYVISIDQYNNRTKRVDDRLFNKSDAEFKQLGYIRKSEYNNEVYWPACN